MDIACRGMRERINTYAENDTCDGNDNDDGEIDAKF